MNYQQHHAWDNGEIDACLGFHECSILVHIKNLSHFLAILGANKSFSRSMQLEEHHHGEPQPDEADDDRTPTSSHTLLSMGGFIGLDAPKFIHEKGDNLTMVIMLWKLLRIVRQLHRAGIAHLDSCRKRCAHG